MSAPLHLEPDTDLPAGASARSYWLGPPRPRHVGRPSPASSPRLCRARAVGGGGLRACRRCGACARAGQRGERRGRAVPRVRRRRSGRRGARRFRQRGKGGGSAGRTRRRRAGARAEGAEVPPVPPRRKRSRPGPAPRDGEGASEWERGRQRSVIFCRCATPGLRSARTPAGSPERGSLRPVLRGGT